MKIFFILFSLILIFSPLIVAVAADDQSVDVIFPNPVNKTDVKAIVGGIIQKALGVVGVIALILFISAGFTWMIAKGDSGKIKTARQIMLWTAIGLLVIFGSYAILSLVFRAVRGSS